MNPNYTCDGESEPEQPPQVRVAETICKLTSQEQPLQEPSVQSEPEQPLQVRAAEIIRKLSVQPQQEPSGAKRRLSYSSYASGGFVDEWEREAQNPELYYEDRTFYDQGEDLERAPGSAKRPKIDLDDDKLRRMLTGSFSGYSMRR